MLPDTIVMTSGAIEKMSPCHNMVFMTSTGIILDHMFTFASWPPDDGSLKGNPSKKYTRY